MQVLLFLYLLIYNYNDDWYLLWFFSFNLSSNISVASFLQTTRKTVCILFISTHLSVFICCFSVSNSVIISVQGSVFLNNSKCCSPQKNFTSSPVSVFPSIVNKQSFGDILHLVILILSLSKWI